MEICGVTWERLAEYQEGHTTGAARVSLETHLAAGCDECQARLDWLERAARVLTAPALNPAPAALQRRARALFRERLRRPAVRPWPLIARLLMGGQAMPALARGEGERGPSEHRVYAVADCEIDLWEEREAGGVSYLIGQILTSYSSAHALTEASLITTEQEAVSLEAAILEENEFHLASVPAGTYTLTLMLGDETILVPNILIGELV